MQPVVVESGHVVDTKVRRDGSVEITFQTESGQTVKHTVQPSKFEEQLPPLPDTSLWYEFSLNENVAVRLNDFGREYRERQWDEMFSHRPPTDYTPKREGEDGWSVWQLHDLMNTFGDLLHSGGNLPFETTQIRINPDVCRLPKGEVPICGYKFGESECQKDGNHSDGRCGEHTNLACRGCGELPTYDCLVDLGEGLLCSAPLCGRCVHYVDGDNHRHVYSKDIPSWTSAPYRALDTGCGPDPKHTKEFGVYLFDGMDRGATFIDHFETLLEAETFVHEHWRGRLSKYSGSSTIDKVDIVKLNGDVQGSWGLS